MLLRHDFKILTIIIIWSSFQYFILGKYSFVLFGDELDPVFSHLMGNKFTDCDRCLWYPFAASGTDQLSLGYTPDFDRILVQLLPGWLAYQIRHILQIAAFVIGLFIMGRHTFGLARPGAYFAALVGGHWLSFALLHGSAAGFLPLLILTISWLLKSPDKLARWSITLAACAFYATTTHINFFVGFPFVIMTIWFFVAEKKYRMRDWVILFGLFIFCMLFRTQDIFSLMMNAPLSHRANWQHYNLSFIDALLDGPGRIIAFTFDPRSSFSYVYNVAFNALPLLGPVMLVGIVLRWKGDAHVRLLGLLIACLALAEIFLPIAKYLLYDVIPVIRGFSMNKLWYMSTFAVILGAGVGFQCFYDWARNENRTWRAPIVRKYLYLTPVFVLVLGDIVEKSSFVAYEWVSQGNYVQAYESPDLTELARKINASGNPSRVSSFQIYDSLLHGYGLETAGGTVVLFSKRYSEFWDKMYEPSAGIDPVADTQRKKAGQTMTMGITKSNLDKKDKRNLSERYRLNFLSLANVKYVVSRDQFTDPQLVLANGVEPKKAWSSLSNWDKALINVKGNFTGRTHINIYENQRVLPRFFLSDAYEIAADNADALNRMANKSEEDLKRSVILSENDLPPSFDRLERFSTEGRIKIKSSGTDRIELEIATKEPALLVAGNSYSPFWVCRIDNVVTPIVPAYTTFWAVRLPAGAKNVTFTYEPPYRLIN